MLGDFMERQRQKALRLSLEVDECRPLAPGVTALADEAGERRTSSSDSGRFFFNNKHLTDIEFPAPPAPPAWGLLRTGTPPTLHLLHLGASK